MKNETIDKINNFFKTSYISPEVPKGKRIIHDTYYNDIDGDGKFGYLIIDSCYASEYYSIVDKIYQKEIQNTYTYDSINHKFHDFLYLIRKQKDQIGAKDYSKFCNRLNKKPILEFEVFHKIYGTNIHLSEPLELDTFCIYNTRLHQKQLKEKMGMDFENISEEFKNDFNSHDTWISVKVSARENSKADELACIQFELFQSICNYVLANTYSNAHINILDNRIFDVDILYTFLHGKFHGSSCTNNKTSHKLIFSSKGINITSVICEDHKLFKEMLNIINPLSHTEISIRIKNSIVFFNRAEQEVLNSQKYILYVMAIEALIEFDKNDIVGQIADYISTLFSNSIDRKNAIEKEFKKIYDIRSKIIHGNQVDINHQYVHMALCYSYDLIHLFLTDPTIKKIAKNDEIQKYKETKKKNLLIEVKHI